MSDEASVESEGLVQLTEDLLYIVNKKLRSMDKAKRDKKLKLKLGYLRQQVTMPFTEVVYRKKNSLDLSETDLAVMHRCNFQSNSTAACELNSMDEFLSHLDWAASFAESSDYRKFLRTYSKPAAELHDSFDVVRFVQLPKDYYRPHSDCLLFGELAWKEDGIMKVEASNFALCMAIWRMKQWVVLSSEYVYPLSCNRQGRWDGDSWRLYDCSCRNLLHAILTDQTIQKFLKDEGNVSTL